MQATFTDPAFIKTGDRVRFVAGPLTGKTGTFVFVAKLGNVWVPIVAMDEVTDPRYPNSGIFPGQDDVELLEVAK